MPLSLAVLRSSNCFEEILSHIPLALVILDEGGQIIYSNSHTTALFGYRAEEIIGAPVRKLIPPPLRAAEDSLLAEVRNGRRVTHFETRRRRKDGVDIDVSLTMSPLRDDAGAIVGACKIMDTLRRSNAELERRNGALDEFVYTVSHDLRAPLTNVASLAQWVLDDDESLGAQTRERLLLIQCRVGRMERLLNDIREYARSGAGPEMAGPQLRASELLAQIIDTLDVPAGFSIHIDPLLEGLAVKRVPLVQVFHNLVINAIKHHDQRIGTITVSVVARGAMWRFVVCDDGPGIPQEYREAIFGMFKTLKPQDEVEGSGMGLALVRKIVSRMGGACGVEAPFARGAQFWFDWPKLPEPGDRAP